MQLINALSLAPDGNDWLANSRHPCILHVFDRACNLINEHREVLSIVTPQVGNGPFNLVVEDDILFSEYLSIESQISVHDNQLILGDLTISTDNAKPWSPSPHWEKLHAKRKDILCQIGPLSIITGQPLLPAHLLSTFCASTATADLPSSVTVARKLAGLGAGVTPAGDDFIVGALLAAWIIHPSEVAKVLAQEILNIAAPLTTSLSAAWLRSAGKGEAGILWHQFFDALVSANPERIQEVTNHILAVGETSGADALAGFAGVFLVWGNR